MEVCRLVVGRQGLSLGLQRPFYRPVDGRRGLVIWIETQARPVRADDDFACEQVRVVPQDPYQVFGDPAQLTAGILVIKGYGGLAVITGPIDPDRAPGTDAVEAAEYLRTVLETDAGSFE